MCCEAASHEGLVECGIPGPRSKSGVAENPDEKVKVKIDWNVQGMECSRDNWIV